MQFMKKVNKILSLFIIICIMLMNGTAYAEEVYAVLELRNAVCTNASFNDGTITINAGGNISFETFLPFHTDSLKVEYTSTSSGQVTILMEKSGKQVSQTFNAATAATEQTVALSQVETRGIQKVKITAVGDITISAITAVRCEDKYDYGERSQFVEIGYTDSQKALQTASILPDNSSMVLIRNAKRYLDIDDMNVKVIRDESQTYVTANIIREVFRICVEESDNEIVIKDFSSDNEIRLTSELLNQNGKKYIPVGVVCENFGMEMYYSDGATLVDEPFRMNVSKPYISDAVSQLATIIQTGTTYHVAQNAPNASDSNDGSEDNPFKTVNAASQIAVAGDRIIVHEGTYRETVSFANDGVAGSHIILEGAEGEDVIVSGADVIENLVETRDGFYLAKVPYAEKYRNQVFINGEVYAEGRTPNETTVAGRLDIEDYVGELSPLWPVEGDIYADKNNETPFILSSDTTDITRKDNFWLGAVWHGLNNEGWRTSAAVIANSRGNTLTIKPAEETGGVSAGYIIDKNFIIDTDYGYLTDHIGTVDVGGEWVIKGTSLYILMPDDVDVDTAVFEYKARQLLFDLTDKEYITIRNIKGFAGSVTTKNSDLCVIEDCEFKYTSHFTWFADSREGYIDDKSDETEYGPQTNGEVGLYIGGSNNVVRNTTIDTSAGAGLFLAGNTAYIENNVITECGYAGIMNAGIYIAFEPWKGKNGYFGGHSVYYNSVSKAGRSPISINSSYTWILEGDIGYPTRYAAMDIAYNDFYEGGIKSGRDGGLFYSYDTILGDDTIRSKIHNNLFWDYYAYDGFDVGMYFDAGTTDGEVYDNLMFYTQDKADYVLPSYNIDNSSILMHKVNLYDWGYGITMYVPGGKANLTTDDYHNGFVFKSGSTMTGGTGTITPTAGNASKYYFKDGTLSSGISVVGEGVKSSQEGETITINDVDFGTASNVIELCFSGSSFSDRDRITMTIDSLSGTKIISKSFITRAADADKYESIILKIPDISGIHDVYVKFEDASDSSVISFIPKYLNPRHNVDTSTEALLIECELFDYGGNLDGKPESWNIRPKADGVNNTVAGSYMCFNGCIFNNGYTTVSIQYATKGINSGNTAKIYLDSMDSTPIAEFLLTGDDWNEKITLEQSISSISAGMHDVYVLFGDSTDDGYVASSDVYEIVFK